MRKPLETTNTFFCTKPRSDERQPFPCTSAHSTCDKHANARQTRLGTGVAAPNLFSQETQENVGMFFFQANSLCILLSAFELFQAVGLHRGSKNNNNEERRLGYIRPNPMVQ